MKITLKLDQRKAGLTKNGYPIIVYATENYKHKSIRIGYYSKLTEWNHRLAIPKSNHPRYYELLDVVQLVKGNIEKVLVQAINRPVELSELKYLIFKKDYTLFYDAALHYLGETNRSTKWSAVRSFNRYQPNASFDMVTRQTVQGYIKHLLSANNKPAGVDSYIRSLRALWNQLTTKPNPFSKHSIEIPDKVNRMPTIADLKVLAKADLSYNGNIGGAGRYRDYWLLMFYLGGIDPEVLSKLRYDKNVSGGRIIFNRDKGMSKVGCSNVIPPQAFEILAKYDCRPYLVPIFKATNYATFRGNFERRLKDLCVNLGLSEQLRPKGARYFFIDRAQQLLIDERITAQIVGHRRKTTTSLYTNNFPLQVQDEAHLRIIYFTNH